MPSRTLTLFNLYYLFSVLQCDLIAVLFIMSFMSNFNSFFIKIYIEFCEKSSKSILNAPLTIHYISTERLKVPA